MVPSTYEDGTLYNVLPSGNKAPDETGSHNGYDQTRADFTFSRGSNLSATRINSDGLIEKGRENLLTYSNDFSNAAWTKVNATLTSGQTGYDGTNNAWKISSSASGSSQIFMGGSNTNLKTHSIYAKAGSVDVFKIWVGSNKEFNLSNGTTSSSNSKITDVGNGWFRCEVFDVFSNYNPFFTATTAGDYIYIQNAQLEKGLVSTPYIETGATTATAGVLENTPRIDYSSGAGALLLEPQRTNVLPQSEYYESSVWTKDSSSVNGNAATSPEGLNNASLLYPTSATTAKWGAGMYDFNSTANDTYTNSVYVKSNGWRWVYMIDPSGLKNAWFDLENGVTGTTESPATSSIESLGNDWYRCSVSSNILHSYTYCGVYFSDADNSYICTSNGTNGTYVYGFQSEAGSHVSSYVPTYGSAATRGADSCSVTGVSDVIGQTEGTMYAEFIMPPAGGLFSHYRISGSGGLYNDSQNITITTTNTIRGWSFTGSGVQANIESGVFAEGTKVKVAYAYKANDFVLYVNGTQIGTDTSGSVPSMSEFLLGSYYPDTSVQVVNQTHQAALFDTRLTNSELATLTTL